MMPCFHCAIDVFKSCSTCDVMRLCIIFSFVREVFVALAHSLHENVIDLHGKHDAFEIHK